MRLNWLISSRGPHQRTQALWTCCCHLFHIPYRVFFYFMSFLLICIIIISPLIRFSAVPTTIIVIKVKLKVTNFRKNFLIISGFLCFSVSMEGHAKIKTSWMFSKNSHFLSWFQIKVIFCVFLAEWSTQFIIDSPKSYYIHLLSRAACKTMKMWFKNWWNAGTGVSKRFYTNTGLKIVLYGTHLTCSLPAAKIIPAAK